MEQDDAEAAAVADSCVSDRTQRALVRVNRVTGTYEWALPNTEASAAILYAKELLKARRSRAEQAVPHRVLEAFADRIRTFQSRVQKRIETVRAALAAEDGDDDDDDDDDASSASASLPDLDQLHARLKPARQLSPRTPVAKKPPLASATAVPRPPQQPAAAVSTILESPAAPPFDPPQATAKAKAMPRPVLRGPTRKRPRLAPLGNLEGGDAPAPPPTQPGGLLLPSPSFRPASPTGGSGVALLASPLATPAEHELPAAKRAKPMRRPAPAATMLPSPTMAPAAGPLPSPGIPPSPGTAPAHAFPDGGLPPSPT
eukprot:TRINITY_DN917_c1_g1_i1.p1 TRINITY_DN917_c1_g1~~TRINITY_DN917_c1_g1_i1.p1  ORF type:complete len:334 (+),score=66.62 TRINITY_DN917_c1_g1_i1:59-1003(+)